MAQSTGILKIEGTIDDLTFYKQNGRNYVRRKGGVSRERIATDSNFVRTRENNTEFAHSGIMAKQLRLALGSLVFKAKDNRLSSRMVQLMSRIKNLDATSVRGQRSVSNGLTTAEGKLLLQGFDFNGNAPLKSVLFAPFDVNFANGKIGFTDFVVAEQLQFPQGATHVSLQCAALAIDFTTEFSEVAYSAIQNLPINLTPNSFNLTTTSVPAGGTSQLFLLMVSFYQEVNGVQYSLKNEEYNVLHVLEVV